jgi:hypothetical protein
MTNIYILHSISWSSNKSLRVDHILNRSNPTRTNMNSFFTFKIKSKPNFDCAVSWRSNKLDIFLLLCPTGFMCCCSSIAVLVIFRLKDQDASDHIIVAKILGFWRGVWLIRLHVFKVLKILLAIILLPLPS